MVPKLTALLCCCIIAAVLSKQSVIQQRAGHACRCSCCWHRAAVAAAGVAACMAQSERCCRQLLQLKAISLRPAGATAHSTRHSTPARVMQGRAAFLPPPGALKSHSLANRVCPRESRTHAAVAHGGRRRALLALPFAPVPSGTANAVATNCCASCQRTSSDSWWLRSCMLPQRFVVQCVGAVERHRGAEGVWLAPPPSTSPPPTHTPATPWPGSAAAPQ
jgi:hypothetical protein